MSETKSVFETLYAVNVSDKIKQKQSLSYLPWASAWAEVKKRYPKASFTVFEQTIDEYGTTRFWFDDGRTGWVKVGVTIEDKTETITLPIMDLRNKPIPADQITSMDANKAQMRCLVKACALHGLGQSLYIGEDLPEDVLKTQEQIEKIDSIAKKKAAISEKAKAQVADFCKAAEKAAFPDMDESLITGNYKNIEDADILTTLEKQLMTIRK